MLATIRSALKHSSLRMLPRALPRVAHVAAATMASSQTDPVRTSLAEEFQRKEKQVTIDVNGRSYDVDEGLSIHDACSQIGIKIPTLCNHPRLRPVGLCRVCLVDVEGARALQPACVTHVRDGMKIKTNSDKVVEGVKYNLALQLAHHPKDCMLCPVNGTCEFQDLIYRYGVDDSVLPTKETRGGLLDTSSPAIVRDLDKCISCMRCVRACDELQGISVYGKVGRGAAQMPLTYANLPLSETDCIGCGQCSVFCPTGAIVEQDHVHRVLDALESKDKVIVVQTAPATRVAISEEIGLEAGSISTGKMVAGLRKIGFDYVFDTDLSADLTIMEEGTELLGRVKNGGPFPMFTSCCPGWINLVEKAYPEFIPNLSSCKSPQQMLGAIIKEHFAKKIGREAKDIYVVSVMPCTAKKDEAQRPYDTFHTEDGVPHVDAVLTTRELGHLARLKNVPFASLPEAKYDSPLGESTGAAVIFGATGGVMEAALRTAYEVATGKALPKVDFEAVRGFEGIKDAVVDVEGLPLRVAVAHGTANVKRLLQEIKEGKRDYHFVEIMACPGGCLGGGGEPYSLDREVLKKRMQGIYLVDRAMTLRKSHENPDVQALYKEWLETPNSHTAHHHLHTHYHPQEKKKV